MRKFQPLSLIQKLSSQPKSFGNINSMSLRDHLAQSQVSYSEPTTKILKDKELLK